MVWEAGQRWVAEGWAGRFKASLHGGSLAAACTWLAACHAVLAALPPVAQQGLGTAGPSGAHAAGPPALPCLTCHLPPSAGGG